MKQLHIVLCLGLMIASKLKAQQFSGFPPSVKWQQINTDTARIIFPAAVNLQAQEIAAIIHKISTHRPNSLGTDIRKINIVLHNNTTLANGYVALGPFRSEYYMIPGSDIFRFGANPWYKELAVHEFRHVLQYSNFKKGWSRFASVLFGEQGQELLNSAAIPDWFWEGDAVHSETSLTPQGRGRTPYFFNGYKSLWREGRNYNWMKLRNGSLKDYVPNHYELGYLLVNYGYVKYGNDFWRKVTSDAAAFKGLFYPFQNAVKKYAGVPFKTFRKEALKYYSHSVNRADTVKRATVTNYYFPQLIAEDSLLYMKSGYDRLPGFYIKDKKGEHKLRLMNISTEDWFSYRNGLIAYTAYETDARWSLKDYSAIYLYNIRTDQEEKLTSRAKYYTPDISPSGKTIVAVSVEESTRTTLQILDGSGKILKIIQPLAQSIFVHPRFIDDNTVVVAERLPNSSMQMSRIDLSSGERKILIPSTYALIGYPFPHKGYVYFVSSASGLDNLYALRLSDYKIFQVEAGVTGKYYPSAFGDSLIWSTFTSNGLVVQKKLLPENFTEANPQLWEKVVAPYSVADAEEISNMLSGLTRKFPVSRYKKGAHLFNFHSWRPGYTDPEFTMSVYSDNVLGNFTNEIYYRYNENETSHGFGFNSSYGGFYPLINTGIEYTLNRTLRDTVRRFDINQFEARIGYSIPLNFTGGRMYRFLNLGSDYVFNQTSLVGGKDSARNQVNYLRHFISWSHYLPRARQHIYPKFGYSFSANLRHLIGERYSQTLAHNAQWLLSGQLFLPSIKNHSIVLSGSYQRVDTNSVIFSNRFANSRGYENYYFRTMWRFSGNYHFPIFYPDFGLANLIYLQRLRANIFYDYTKVYSGYFGNPPSQSRNLRSTGAEIYFDTKFWNQLPVSFGIRISHLLDDGFTPQDRKGNTWMEFILPLDLIPD